jgi:hypothetical protein
MAGVIHRPRIGVPESIFASDPFMSHAPRGFDSEAIARKWLALADRRLLYFCELHRSGRWTRYCASQEQFAEQMHEAIKAAQIWARLAGVRGLAEDAKDELRPAA